MNVLRRPLRALGATRAVGVIRTTIGVASVTATLVLIGEIVAIGAMGPVGAVGAVGQDAQPPERGEQLLNGSCRTCHDLKPVDIKALDQVGWTKLVKSMIEQGAELEAEDVAVLVDYLVKHHGPLPDGPGKDILLNTCTQCHDLQRIRRQGRSAEGWLEILDAMLNEGAALSEQDYPVLLGYLARNFRPERERIAELGNSELRIQNSQFSILNSQF